MAKHTTICAGSIPASEARRALDRVRSACRWTMRLMATTRSCHGCVSIASRGRDRGERRLRAVCRRQAAAPSFCGDCVSALAGARLCEVSLATGQERQDRCRLDRHLHHAAKKIHAPPDPRLAPFAEHLTMIDQLSEDIARVKNRIETCRDARIRRSGPKRSPVSRSASSRTQGADCGHTPTSRSRRTARSDR